MAAFPVTGPRVPICNAALWSINPSVIAWVNWLALVKGVLLSIGQASVYSSMCTIAISPCFLCSARICGRPIAPSPPMTNGKQFSLKIVVTASSICTNACSIFSYESCTCRRQSLVSYQMERATHPLWIRRWVSMHAGSHLDLVENQIVSGLILNHKESQIWQYRHLWIHLKVLNSKMSKGWQIACFIHLVYAAVRWSSHCNYSIENWNLYPCVKTVRPWCFKSIRATQQVVILTRGLISPVRSALTLIVGKWGLTCSV